jgi:hypothetical protein
VRQQGSLDGTGVRVGVVSDGLKGVFASGCTNCSGLSGGPIATGDLPDSVGVRNSTGVLVSSTGGITGRSFQQNGDLEGLPPAFPVCGFDGAGAEGTAMLEIIHDLAPGARLSFANIDTDLSFVQAVNYLASTNDIVVDDLGFFGEAYDGMSAVSAGTAAALNNPAYPIRAYFTAVGNFKIRPWQAHSAPLQIRWVRPMTDHPGFAALALAVVTTGGFGLRSGTTVFATQPRYQETGSMERHDDLLVRVEQQVPGFGGMFIDREGRLAVYLLDTSQLGAARAAIEAVFGVDSVPAAGVRALQGQYVVSQLKAWSAMAADLLEMPGVTAVDLDEARNRVAIGVEHKSRTRAVERALSAIAIPRHAVMIQVTEKIRPVHPPRVSRPPGVWDPSQHAWTRTRPCRSASAFRSQLNNGFQLAPVT